jgi:hypothetical protein
VEIIWKGHRRWINRETFGGGWANCGVKNGNIKFGVRGDFMEGCFGDAASSSRIASLISSSVVVVEAILMWEMDSEIVALGYGYESECL